MVQDNNILYSYIKRRMLEKLLSPNFFSHLFPSPKPQRKVKSKHLQRLYKLWQIDSPPKGVLHESQRFLQIKRYKLPVGTSV